VCKIWKRCAKPSRSVHLKIAAMYILNVYKLYILKWTLLALYLFHISDNI
jgi:hypothetical protein